MSNKRFSPNFMSLMESLHSSEEVYNVQEDRETRQEKRQERRQERREKRFEEKGNLKAFIQNLETLKSQLISNVVDTDHWIQQNPGSTFYPGYKKTFIDLLERVAKIMGDAIYISKKEGKKLEAEDQEVLKGLLDNYNDIKGEYESTAGKYSSGSTQEVIKGQKELKYKEISAKLIAAAKYFQEAAQENLKLLDSLKSGKAPEGSEAKQGESAGEVKVESPIKKGAGSKKEPNEKVREVQKLILGKFKNNERVKKSSVWKNFAKYKPDGIFGNATASIIPPLKAGFGMSDTTSDITQDFINKLTAVKEALMESVITSFSDFMRINEDFDFDAFEKSAKSSSSASGKSKSQGSSGSGESKKEETKKEETKNKVVKSYDTKAINEKAFKIFLGFSGELDEDEQAIFDVIKTIKDKREFELVEASFAKMKIQKLDLRKSRFSNAKRDWQYFVDKNKDYKTYWGLRKGCVPEYFNSSEIARLNSYLPDGVEKF